MDFCPNLNCYWNEKSQIRERLNFTDEIGLKIENPRICALYKTFGNFSDVTTKHEQISNLLKFFDPFLNASTPFA